MTACLITLYTIDSPQTSRKTLTHFGIASHHHTRITQTNLAITLLTLQPFLSVHFLQSWYIFDSFLIGHHCSILTSSPFVSITDYRVYIT